jgi:hypothetical protein
MVDFNKSFGRNFYLGGWVQATENPNPVPDFLDSFLVVVKGVLPPAKLGFWPSSTGGSSSK